MRGGGGTEWQGQGREEPRGGRTKSERGEGASESRREGEGKRETVRVRRRERRAGKGGQLRKSAQKRSSHSCSDPGWEGKFSSAGGEKKKKHIRNSFFFSHFFNLFIWAKTSEDSLERRGKKKKEESESFCSLRVSSCRGRWIQTPESRVTETSLQVRHKTIHGRTTSACDMLR